MVKTLSSNIKDSQHALEIFRGFNFPGKKKLIFTEDIIVPTSRVSPYTSFVL